jgi:cation diffusion facilitator family transporter
VNPQRRIALVSVLAAAALIALKLVTGILTDSLGLLSEAAHSGTDLVAALLTFFAVGVAVRPADRGHHYGHGKAEHLAALAEASILVGLSLVIAWRAISHLVGRTEPGVEAKWYALAAIGVVMAIDVSRATVSYSAAARYSSAAFQANALHFITDLLGSGAVLGGLIAVRAGWREGDAAAALFVGVLVLFAAGRLIRRNVDVLMDRAPAGAAEAVRQAIEGLSPRIRLRRLRLRQAAGHHFADVVIAVPPGVAVGQGHAAADAVEEAVQRAIPETDVVVHVEPDEEDAVLRERALAAASRVASVREIHNVSVLDVDGHREISLHLKLPGELTLDEAHAVAEEVERAIEEAMPEVDSVQTHLEPLAEEAAGRRPAHADVATAAAAVARITRELTGSPPRELRFLETDDGLVLFLTLEVDGTKPLADAHALASSVEERVRRECPDISEVIVHTEP